MSTQWPMSSAAQPPMSTLQLKSPPTWSALLILEKTRARETAGDRSSLMKATTTPSLVQVIPHRKKHKKALCSRCCLLGLWVCWQYCPWGVCPGDQSTGQLDQWSDQWEYLYQTKSRSRTHFYHNYCSLLQMACEEQLLVGRGKEDRNANQEDNN